MTQFAVIAWRKHLNISVRYTCLLPALTGGAAAWWIAGNDARKAQTSKVQSKFVVIIFANQFGMHLGNAVNGARPLNLQGEEKEGPQFEYRTNCRQGKGKHTVMFGVGLRGLSGPKAPMVLGTKMRSLYCLASSITLWTPSMLTLEEEGSYVICPHSVE